MKFIVTITDPDGLSDSICEAANNSTKSVAYEMTPSELVALQERRAEGTWESLRPWTGGIDVLRIEIDPEAGAARVLRHDE